tara:strand:+ start:1043 stop:1531 length:489 start_codon:yes stop_codon:yes gene_type:complete
MATNLQFIKSQKADNVSSLTVNNIFSADYDIYEVIVIGNGSQNVSSLSAEFVDSGGSDIGQGAYDTAIHRLHYNQAFDDVRTTGANSFEFAFTSHVDHDFATKLTIYNPFSSSKFTFANMQSASQSAEKNIVFCGVTTSATGMKFSANQNFTPIHVNVYGVK